MEKLKDNLLKLKDFLNKSDKNSKLKKKLIILKEELSKAMKQGGIGGKGAVKLGAILPSIKSLPANKTSGNNSRTPSTGITQPSKKNPLKQAEQIQNKDIKDIKIKEAKSLIKFDNNGQWSMDKTDDNTITYRVDLPKKKAKRAYLKDARTYAEKGHTNKAKRALNEAKGIKDNVIPINIKNPKPIEQETITTPKDLKAASDVEKSGYDGYTETDNIKRKVNNLSDSTNIKTMNRIKRYGGSGANAAAKEAKVMRQKSKKNPVKIFSREEINAINLKNKV